MKGVWRILKKTIFRKFAKPRRNPLDKVFREKGKTKKKLQKMNFSHERVIWNPNFLVQSKPRILYLWNTLISLVDFLNKCKTLNCISLKMRFFSFTTSNCYSVGKNQALETGLKMWLPAVMLARKSTGSGRLSNCVLFEFEIELHRHVLRYFRWKISKCHRWCLVVRQNYLEEPKRRITIFVLQNFVG